MSGSNLKAYMGWKGDPEDGAVLIFAHNVKEAKRMARGTVINDGDWTDLRVGWLKGKDFLFSDANQDLLKKGIAHVEDSPTSCKICELWGNELDARGVCDSCVKEA